MGLCALFSLFTSCSFTLKYRYKEFYIMLILRNATPAGSKTFPGVVFPKMLKSLIRGSH
jgi:hypothetical protein